MANLVSFQSLTAAEYEALSGEYVENRIYFITDTGEIKLNGVNYGGNKQEEPDYLYFESTADGSTLKLNKYFLESQTTIPSAALSAELEYSTDGKNWSTYSWTGESESTPTGPSNSRIVDFGQTISLDAGDKVFFRGENEIFSPEFGHNVFYKFDSTGSIKIAGDIMSLLDKNLLKIAVPNGTFQDMFRANTSYIDISGLKLSAASLGNACYYGMFIDDTGLAMLPQVNADANATISGTNDNGGIFGAMMRNTGITAADLRGFPEIVSRSAYTQLFRNCASLTSVTVHWTTWPTFEGTVCTTNWLQNVAATGTFHCPAGLTIPSRDISGVPSRMDYRQ